MSTIKTTIENDRRKPTSSRTPPVSILVLLCLALLLLQFDEKSFAGWFRLAAIWSAAVGACLLATVTTYLVTWFFKLRSGSPISKLAYGLCLIACCWSLVGAVRDTRRALDPNRWLEIGMEFAHLPFEVREDQSFYVLNLDPAANDGLHRVQTTAKDKRIWPENYTPDGRHELEWGGWLCTFRNRGTYSMSDITFDTPVSYTYGSEAEPKQWAVHHVRIPVLAPNETLQVILGSAQDRVTVNIYKPKAVLARIGNETNKRNLQTRLLPFAEKFWNRDYWFLTGPDELPLQENSGK